MLTRLYEDAHYLLVNKPAGVPADAGRPNPTSQVLAAVRMLRSKSGSDDLRTCYPLDTFESGVWGLAKTEQAAEQFAGRLREGDVRQVFVAVARGKYKAHKVAAQREKSSAKATPPRSNRRETPLDVTPIKQYARRALLRCVFHGRRSMDVRVQLQRMHVPVVDDPKFDFRRKGRRRGRLYLHVERLEFEHPFTGEPVLAVAPVPDSFDAVAREETPLEDSLEVALAGRLERLLDESTNAYRLTDGAADGIPGLIAELLGPVVILQLRQGKFDEDEEALQRAAAWYGRRLKVRAVYVKKIPRDRSQPDRHRPKALMDERPLWGRPVKREVEILEDGIRYVVRPYDGYLTGFFTAHAENRRWVRRHAKGLHVLNLFAYTCGFSVAAAIGDAATTASADVSKKALEWGKENFEANGLSLDDHRFYCSDAFEFFRRAERQGLRFDLIVLDPPAFARGGKPARVFQVEKHMTPLVSGALKLLKRRGRMLVSANFRGVTDKWLRERVKAATGRRKCRFPDPPPLPLGFAPERRESETIVVRFD
jgi:23S rRNA (cytosine1962-C5)-methyltransferase